MKDSQINSMTECNLVFGGKPTRLQIGDVYLVNWDNRTGTGTLRIMRGEEAVTFSNPSASSTKFHEEVSARLFGLMIAALAGVTVNVEPCHEQVRFTVTGLTNAQ